MTRRVLLIPGLVLVALAAAATKLPDWYRTWRAAAVGSLLNRAYEEHRSLELRMEGARFSVLSLNRGLDQPSEPSPLLEQARAEIMTRKDSGEPEWIHLKGRLYILLLQPEEAVTTLKQLHQLLPKSTPILIDLATAHVQKAELEGSDFDLGTALEYLGEALRLEPGNTTALYNAAITEEKQFLYRLAAETWHEYLKRDSSTGWAEEAMVHLRAVEEKLNEHSRRMTQPTITTEALAHATANQRELLLQAMEASIEEYADAATRDWLPRAYGPVLDQSSLLALRALSIYMAESHRDPWFRDFLASTPRSKTAAQAVRLLSGAARANAQGNPLEGERLAGQASSLFLAIGSLPGLLGAKVEQINSLRQLFRSSQCIRASDSIGRSLGERRYHQLLARMMLEKTGCLLRVGNESGAVSSLKQASIAVDKGRLLSQRINVLNYESAIEITKGEFSATWRISRTALDLYWNGLFSAKRAYPFYIRLSEWAEENGKPYIFFAFAREAAATIDATDLPAFQAMAHYRLAEAAVADRRYDIAREEFTHSEEIFAGLTQNESTSIYRTDIGILLAKLEAQEGETDPALRRLDTLEPLVRRLESFLVKYQFYSTRAAILASQFENESAEKSYRQAIAAAESLLKTVQSERERLMWSRQYGSVYRGLSQVLLRQNRTAEAFLVWESYRASDLRSFAEGAGEPSAIASLELENIQRDLGDEVGLVYMFTTDGLATWIVSKNKLDFRFARLNHQEVARSAKHLSVLCSDRDSSPDDFRTDARLLYRQLMEPVENLVGSHPLLVEPDEDLADIPFQALIDGHDRYVIEGHQVSYLPSLFYVNQLPRGALAGPLVPLAVAVSTAPEKYRHVLLPLPDAAREVKSIARLISATHPLLDRDANAEAISHWLGRSNAFHFAGHSLYDHGRLGLLLSGSPTETDPLLDLSRLAPQVKNLYLVVLSACTSQGLSGESFHDPENIARSVLQARVPHTIASRWDVDSETTAEFMEGFYSDFSLRRDAGGSFARAVNECRKHHPHPFYWAAFSQFGRN